MKRIYLFAFLITVLFTACAASEEDEFFSERQKMVKEQIELRGITDMRIINAMLKVRRHLFVPAYLRGAAYADKPLPIGLGQTISQPYIVAYMTQAAKVGPEDRVLEIGTGSGYQAAILGEVAKEVFTIEILKPLADRARMRLGGMGYKNVKVKWGDGFNGWKEHAPFDAIVITAAPAYVPEELIDQLKIGGHMVVPIGLGRQELYLITRTRAGYYKETLLPVAFVPMVGGSGGRGMPVRGESSY
jgi:protein-L-isoaspartate(D-aspartate) O-methyltransferase